MSPKVSKHDGPQEERTQGPLIRSLCKQIYDANEFAAEWVESPKRARMGGRETTEKKKKRNYITRATLECKTCLRILVLTQRSFFHSGFHALKCLSKAHSLF